MADSSEMVTVTCPDHHQTLTNGLWNFLQCEYEVDFDLKCPGRDLSAHRHILELFLSPDKLRNTVAGWQPDSTSEIDCLLQFLYRGTVTIPKSQLGILLQFARQSEFGMMVDALESAPKVGEPDANLKRQKYLQPPPKKRVRNSKAVSRVNITHVDQPIEAGADWQDTPANPDPNQGSINPSNSNRQCHLCSKRYAHSRGVRRHLKLVHQIDLVKRRRAANSKSDPSTWTFRCDECQKMFCRAYLLRRHRLIHTIEAIDPNKSNRHCHLCSKEYASARGLQKHLKLVHQVDFKPPRARPNRSKSDPSTFTFRCEECQMMFGKAHHLQRHQLTHTNERPYQCHLCQRAFREKRSLENHHRLTHSGESQPVQVAPGSESIELNPLIDNQEASDQVNSDRKCQLCSKTFTTTGCARRHLKSVHKVEVRPSYRHANSKCDPSTFTIPCDQCPMKFARKHYLQRHQLSHSNERPYLCHLCHLTFKEHFTLNSHLLTHRDEKPYRCTPCDLTFDGYSAFKSHIITHKVGKYFDCSVCKESFANIMYFSNHVRLRHANITLDLDGIIPAP